MSQTLKTVAANFFHEIFWHVCFQKLSPLDFFGDVFKPVVFIELSFKARIDRTFVLLDMVNSVQKDLTQAMGILPNKPSSYEPQVCDQLSTRGFLKARCRTKKREFHEKATFVDCFLLI